MNKSRNQLTLGGLDLIGEVAQGDSYRIIVTGDDATWGNPTSVTSTMKGLLRDGAAMSLDSWESREAFLRVTITAHTGDGLADGEAALFAELGRRNTLTWTPSGGFSTPTVFEVEWSELDHEFKPITEALGRVDYGVRLICRPFARSVDPVITEPMSAPPPPTAPTVTLLDACNSTSGWTAYPSPAAHASGYVYNSTWPNPDPEWTWGNSQREVIVQLTRNVTTSMPAATPYLVVEWCRERRDWATLWTPPTLSVAGPDDYFKPPIKPILTRTLDQKWAQSTYDLSGITTVSKMQFEVRLPTGYQHRLHIRQIDRTDQVPANGTSGHQFARTIRVEGSARTEASIHMWHAAPLGDVLVHTSSTPNGMFSLDPFLTSPSASAAGAVSGSLKNMTSPVTYRVPASMFDPERATGYLLMGRLSRGGAGAITTTVRSSHGVLPTVTPVGDAQVQSVEPAHMSAQTIVCLGAFNMPPHRVVGEEAGVDVTVTLASPQGTPTLDDLWFVDIEAGALTWVNNVGKHLRIAPPSTQSPRPRVWEADDATGSRASDLLPLSLGSHEFPPGDVHVYTVAAGATSSNMQLEYFPRWHTHARRLRP